MREGRAGRRARATVAAVVAVASMAALAPAAAAEDVAASASRVRPPVLTSDFPDPEIVWDPASKRWYAFATNVHAGQWFNVPVRSSPDLRDWTDFHGDALPELPSWARRDAALTWAPSVEQLGSRWFLYYSARHISSDRQCVGVAIASRPEGPYSPARTSPLVCQVALGGSIDPSTFRDPHTGHLWLHWKSDENADGGNGSPRIFAQRLASDGVQLQGARVPVLGVTHGVEQPLIENPDMHYARGYYWLYYSASVWDTQHYFTHVARCSGPAGPCTKVVPPTTPFLSRQHGATGPGGARVFSDGGGEHYVAFHAWSGGIGYPAGGRRVMYVERLTYDGPARSPRLRPDLSRSAAPGPPAHDGSRLATPPPGTRFTDVPSSAFFARPVAWASGLGVTTGVGGSNRFEPHRPVTRAELATLMWRMAGRPATTGAGFADVPGGSYYDTATRWMRRHGISTGVGGSNRFEPHRPVSRAEAVTFLWRLAGSPRPAGSQRFVDVSRASFYDLATRWASENRITTGDAGSNRFEPHRQVSRGEAVTFQWRYVFEPRARGERAHPVIG